jgi:predicted HNH restriction endonuclease
MKKQNRTAEAKAKRYNKVKTWRKNAKVRLVEGFGGACGICGLKDDPIVYDFHHVDASKKEFGLSSKIRSFESLVEEANKCIMLCSHCHRKVHADMLTIPKTYPKFMSL